MGCPTVPLLAHLAVQVGILVPAVPFEQGVQVVTFGNSAAGFVPVGLLDGDLGPFPTGVDVGAVCSVVDRSLHRCHASARARAAPRCEPSARTWPCADLGCAGCAWPSRPWPWGRILDLPVAGQQVRQANASTIAVRSSIISACGDRLSWLTTARVQPCPPRKVRKPIESEAGQTVSVDEQKVRNLPLLNALRQIQE